MYRDRDFGLVEEQIPNAADLTQDLELNTLLLAMASGDEFLRDVARKAVLASLYEPGGDPLSTRRFLLIARNSLR